MTRTQLRTGVRWAVYFAVAVVFAIACVFLSRWQFGRNQERAHQLALVSANYNAQPVALSATITTDGQFDADMEWHPVEVQGVYDTADQLLVRNRVHNGTSTFEVLTPLHLDNGEIFIIDRGWVPAAETGDGAAHVPAPPDGEVTVIVRIRPGEPLPRSGRTAPAGQVPTLNLPLVAQTTGSETITSAYGMFVSETPAAATNPYPLEAPTKDPGPYLSYAIQWILFAVMGFGFIGYVIRTETRKDKDQKEPPRRAKKKLSDEVVEDELIDAAQANVTKST